MKDDILVAIMMKELFDDEYRKVFTCSNCNNFKNKSCKGKGLKYDGVMKCLEEKAKNLEYLIPDDILEFYY